MQKYIYLEGHLVIVGTHGDLHTGLVALPAYGSYGLDRHRRVHNSSMAKTIQLLRRTQPDDHRTNYVHISTLLLHL